MVIYLEDYRKAKDAPSPTLQERYDDELLCVNWNPTVAVAAMFGYRQPHELTPQLPDDLASIDLDAFLERVYALASQV